MTLFKSNGNLLFPNLKHASELFISHNELKVTQSFRLLPFCDISFETQKILADEINKNIAIKLELHDMHPTSPMKRLEQFAKCRFGGLDFQGKIKNGELQEGAYWDCPNRGKCKSEGILCKLHSSKVVFQS
jgi:hypothetical protein